MQLTKNQIRIAAVVTSAILAVLAFIIVYLSVQQPKFVRFHGQPINSTINSLLVFNQYSPKKVASIQESREVVKISISSPNEISYDRSPNVELTFDQKTIVFIPHSSQDGSIVSDMDEITPQGTYRKYNGHYPGGGATLTSKTFDISPQNRCEKPEGANVPVNLRWTITPKRKGLHKLELDISELVQQETEDVIVSNTVTHNGIELKDAVLDDIVLFVKVYTIWGISEKTFGICKALGGLVAFFFMYPIVIHIMKQRLGIKDENG